MYFYHSDVFHLLQWLSICHEEVSCEDTGLCPYSECPHPHCEASP